MNMNLRNILKISSLLFSAMIILFFLTNHAVAQAPSSVSATSNAADNGAINAPSEAKAKGSQKSKKTTIDFEDQLIEGSRQKPELFYLLQNKDFNYKRLIRLREDFLPELRKTGEDVQGRAGSGQ